jgi:phage-related holin
MDIKLMTIIKNIVLSLVILFSPIKAAIYVMASLITLDTITGVWAALKRGEIFSSHKFFDSITKIIIYDSLIIMAFLLETFMIPYIPCLKMVMAYIAITEFTSLLENAGFIVNRDIVTYFREQIKNFKNYSNKK